MSAGGLAITFPETFNKKLEDTVDQTEREDCEPS